ncbi:MAG TPA: SRPBCC domain-containing protein [Burkholderiaceae bacterium]|nr:SRPBCC domain-containing protein [Burkholderiaceae bacterium]
MHRIETQIEINAPAERVWSLLMDFPSYPRWNPFIRSIEGNPMVGQSLNVLIQPPGSKAMRFRPTVLKVEPNREFRWKGKLLVPGLFDGEHYFKLEPKPGGGLVFRQGEVFSGLLVPLLKRSLDGATRQGFIAMNEALGREAEKK